MDERWLVDAHGVRVFSRSWLVDTPVGVVIVLHSLADHSGRYDELAGSLNRAGFAVVALDLRGHGQTPDVARRGLAGLRGGRAIIDDIHMLRHAVTELTGDVPVFVVGHSAGSLIGVAYLVTHGAGLAGAVLCAVPDGVEDLGSVARVLQTAAEAGLRDERVIGQLGDFNAAYEPARTEFDWMSRDAEQVDRYIADPLCGDEHPVTFGYMIDLFSVIAPALDHLGSIPCPVLVIAGGDDAIGARGVSAARLGDKLEAVDVDVAVTIYDGARNDLFHEINRDQVTADVIAWLAQHLSIASRATAG